MYEVFNSSVLEAINRAVQDGISTTVLEVDGTPQYCIINAETREIEIPGELNIFGVESDEKSTRVYFRCPKYVGTNVDIDMTQCMVYVPYRNANGEKDQYIVTDLNETEDGENVEFTWLISRKASAYMGITEFGIRAIKTATGGTIEAEWNTTVASANVIRGMDVGILEFSEENKDALAQALDLINQKLEQTKNEMNSEIETKGQQTLATIPDDYTTASQNALSAKTEVENIRVGFDGTTYDSAGEAVREQFTNASKYYMQADSTAHYASDDNKGWRGTIGERITQHTYTRLKSIQLCAVKTGDVFRIKSSTVGGWDNGYYILDNNFNVLKLGRESYGIYDVTLTIEDDSAAYLAVNENKEYDDFLFYFISKPLEETNATLEETNATLEETNAILEETNAILLNNVLNGVPFTPYAEIEGDIQLGLYNKNTGTVVVNADYYRCGTFPVSPGNVYAVTGVSWNSVSYPLLSFLDNEGHFLKVLFDNNTSTDIKYDDFIFIVPDNTDISTVIVNGTDSQLPSLKNVLPYDKGLSHSVEKDINDVAWFNKSMMDAVIDEQKKNPFEWGTFDKGVIIFTFDDSLNDIDLVEQLSESYEVPVCYAAVASKMNNITTATGNNKPVKEVLTEAQLFGNEILCHGSGALNADSTDDDIYNVFVKNKQDLESYGFIVNGIIEIGSGGGEKTFDSKRAEKYLRTLYRYSDSYGRNLNLPNYYNPRTYINRNKETNHTAVDQCETGKSLLIFATHSITNDDPESAISTSQDILEDLFSYVKTKNVHLLTFKDTYDKFRSSKFENMLNG